jgi:hypothetical protein
LHSYPFSEMAENIMFDSMLGYYWRYWAYIILWNINIINNIIE